MVPSSGAGVEREELSRMERLPPGDTVVAYTSSEPSADTATGNVVARTSPRLVVWMAARRAVARSATTGDAQRVASHEKSAGRTGRKAHRQTPSRVEVCVRARLTNRDVAIRDDVVEFETCVPDVAQSLRRILYEASRHQSPQRGRHIVWKCGPVRRVLDDAGEDVGRGRTGERPPAGQHLVEHNAERPDVARLSTGRPRACSGDMYAAVPRISPASVADLGRASASSSTSSDADRRTPSPGRNRAP